MKVSLNKLVMMLADRVGQPFSVVLQRQLKVILNYKRADYFQKILDKHPEQRKYFLKSFTAPLQDASKAECPITTTCKVKRTVLSIPRPVRTDLTLFDYVGDAEKDDSYRLVTPDQLKYIAKSRYTGKKAVYYYENGYIYIYNDTLIEDINVRGVFSDPRELSPFKCANQPCYTDDDQYDIPEDIINTIIQDTIKNELRLVLNSKEAGEVEATER